MGSDVGVPPPVPPPPPPLGPGSGPLCVALHVTITYARHAGWKTGPANTMDHRHVVLYAAVAAILGQ